MTYIPFCPKHGEAMVLVVYERPGSPPGNGWGCRSCMALRAYEKSANTVAENKS